MVCLNTDYLALVAPVPTTTRWLGSLDRRQQFCMLLIIGSYLIHGLSMSACILVDSYFQVTLYLRNFSEPTVDSAQNRTNGTRRFSVSLQINNGLWMVHETKKVSAGVKDVEDQIEPHFTAARSVWNLCRIRSIRPVALVTAMMLSLGIGLIILFTSLLCIIFDRRCFITGSLAGAFGAVVTNIMIEAWKWDMSTCMQAISLGMDGKTRYVLGRIFDFTPAGPAICYNLLTCCNAGFLLQLLASFYMLFINPNKL
ncbi:hypothetical protein AAHC03_05637 [Spirometra sp. Aus1]